MCVVAAWGCVRGYACFSALIMVHGEGQRALAWRGEKYAQEAGGADKPEHEEVAEAAAHQWEAGDAAEEASPARDGHA